MKFTAPAIPDHIVKRKEKLNDEVHHLMSTTIPEKVAHLTQLEHDPRFDLTRLEPPRSSNDATEAEGDEPSAKRKTVDRAMDVIVPNASIKDIYAILKPELKFLLRICLKVSVWIQLLIPRVEDGNNFGVSVQETILEEIGRIQQDIGTYLDQFTRYHLNRTKIISKSIKYPPIGDIYEAIREMDEKEFLNLQIISGELPNYYHSLFDILVKNYAKITCPRSDHHGSMY
ncbi:Proteasome activator complex subunit 3 [Thelohanellus kitauei]|uniref:Proteasome activator complex subunit 3 n=1 Tax=Thelohanellus kitauei TaxID=669202 RepID=A0A0C2IST3_THEKT|nr:Proteasome activator complex subunit 3 [Thelohanellus kitauei]